MSDVKQALEFLENSTLGKLLLQVDITDITFNGESIYYQSTVLGRQKSDITLTFKEAYQFIKQLANLMNIAFTYLDPIVEMSIMRYRVFAVGPTITRKYFQPSISFAIRIHSPLKHQNYLFLQSSPWRNLFKFLISKHLSFVIAGKTGSGKTQLQKELLGLIPASQRVIVMDNILELDGLDTPHLDLTIWQIQKNEDFQRMITGALRSHPDWLLIAEARGEEFKEVFRSVKTGHPIITTLHSDDIDNIYGRMISMLLIGESLSLQAQLLDEVRQSFPILVQLEAWMSDKGIQRMIQFVQIYHHGQAILFQQDVSEVDINQFIQSW